jgi:hypothetical protein
MSSTKNLSMLFQHIDEITYVYDCDILGKWLKSKGLRAYHIDCTFSAKNIISIQTTLHHYKKMYKLVEEIDAYSVNVPLLSFDNSPKAAIYVCERIFETDFISAFDYHHSVIRELGRSENPIKLKNDLVDLACTFSDDVHYVYPKSLIMTQERTRSLLEYLEIHFEHTNVSLPAEFNITGKLKLRGALCATSPNVQDIKYDPETVLDMNKLINTIAASNSAWLEVHNNQVLALSINGEDYTDLLKRLAGETRGLTVTEFAFGLNSSIRKNADWTINSPINEGARGIHVGIGDGRTGLHIDLISYDLDVISGVEHVRCY